MIEPESTAKTKALPRRKRALHWIRRGHLYFGLFLFPWALLYGVILCNARAMGEFGAVSVVSGHIQGKTNTLPLHVELLYNNHQAVAAFAMASLLALLGLVTLIAKTWLELKHPGSCLGPMLPGCQLFGSTPVKK